MSETKYTKVTPSRTAVVVTWNRAVEFRNTGYVRLADVGMASAFASLNMAFASKYGMMSDGPPTSLSKQHAMSPPHAAGHVPLSSVALMNFGTKLKLPP